MIFGKTPLARKNLLHSGRRLAAATAGISFAVVLMFTQIGFKNALFDSTVKLIADLDADVLLVSRAQYALPAKHAFSRHRIYQARSCPGVAGVYPVYLESFYANWRPRGGKGHPIRAIGFELGDPVFLIPEVVRQSDALAQPGTALVDTQSKAKYGIPDTLAGIRSQTGSELSDKSIRLVGTFEMGTDFANDGNLIMSARNFADYFSFLVPWEDPLGRVDLGVVQVTPGADVESVRRRLEEILPNDVAVQTKDQFIRREIDFWATSTPIGYIFTMGAVIGFVVGVVICYQVIYSGIADRMAEFATLKAMGYPGRFFIQVVLQTAFYLSIVSYLPGVLISLALYEGLAEYTGLLMILNVPRAAAVYLVTLAMCVTSACLAVRKVLAADPADLF